MYICTNANKYVYRGSYVDMQTYKYVCMLHVCMYARVHVCMYVCMYVCTYVRMYVCMYIHMYMQGSVLGSVQAWVLSKKAGGGDWGGGLKRG